MTAVFEVVSSVSVVIILNVRIEILLAVLESVYIIVRYEEKKKSTKRKKKEERFLEEIKYRGISSMRSCIYKFL